MEYKTKARVREYYNRLPQEKITGLCNRYRRMIERSRIINRLEDGIILDLGCGDGRLANEVKSFFPSSTLILLDISRAQLSQAKRLLKNLHLEKDGIHLILSDAEQLPFKSNVFNSTFSLGTFEYIKEPRKAMGDIRRTLKKRGKAVIQFHNKKSLFSALAYKFNVIKHSRKDEENAPLFPVDVAFFQPSELEKIASCVDMEAKTFGYYVLFPVYSKLVMITKTQTSWMLQFLLYLLVYTENMLCKLSLSKFLGLYFTAELSLSRNNIHSS